MQAVEKAKSLFEADISASPKKHSAFWAAFIETEIDSFPKENCWQIYDLPSKFLNFDFRL